MEEEDLKLAFSNCRIKFQENITAKDIEEDITEMKSLLQDQKERVEDCEDDILRIKRRADKEIQAKKDRIKEINEIIDNNQVYLDQRESVIRELDVIEYKRLNPNLQVL